MTAPTSAEVLQKFADARFAEIFSALPAFVKTYDPATQTADLEIAVKPARAVDEEDVEHEDFAIVPNVRVIFPSATGTSISFPIATGDTVLFVVASLSVGEFRRKGETADAVQLRRNHPGCGGWAIPVRLLDADPIEHGADNALVLHHDTMVKIGKDAAAAIAKADLVEAQLQDIQTALTTHKHSGVTTGPGTTGTSDSTYVAGQVGSEKGFVE